MNKITLGIITGTVLGILDGCSAFLSQEAVGFMTEILIGSTLKGFINGLFAGIIAKKVSVVWRNGIFSAIVGLVLSYLAALTSGSYLEIILPGIILGLLTGLITGKWGKKMV